MPFEAPIRKLLEDANFCHVGTVSEDGSAHVTPVWVHTDGELIELNSAEGRLWVRNADRDGRVTCTVTSMENPYEFAEIRGTVAERTNEGADEHIDFLNKKYKGTDSYPHKPGEQRVIFRIAPERVRHRIY
jgi:PPOX class probable F420-dependent enzyme